MSEVGSYALRWVTTHVGSYARNLVMLAWSSDAQRLPRPDTRRDVRVAVRCLASSLVALRGPFVALHYSSCVSDYHVIDGVSDSRSSVEWLQ